MKVFDSLSAYDLGPAAVTIGFFDGVHAGHRALLRALKFQAEPRKLPAVVITFARHPREILHASYVPKLLTTKSERLELLERNGVDACIMLDPDREFFEKTSTTFVREELSAKLQTKLLVIGYDHHFGSDRENGYEHYCKLGEKYGFEVFREPAYEIGGEKISSSFMRRLLEEGDLARFRKYADYDFFISGTVVSGRKVGHSMGFPTANIAISDVRKFIPRYGVYAVKVKIEGDGRVYDGMLNIGNRPTFTGISASNACSIEVHILDFNQNIYKKGITVYFKEFLRSETKFESPERLSQQLRQDAEDVRSFFGRN